VLLDDFTYYRTRTGGVVIHLSPIPRLLLAGIGAVIVGLIAAAFLPLLLALLAVFLAAALAYAWAGRPSTAFDCTSRVMVRHWRRIPFADLDRFHTIERRDEERQLSGFAELLMGPRLLVRYEVYTRFGGELLVVAYCQSKAAATELVSEINALLMPDHDTPAA